MNHLWSYKNTLQFNCNVFLDRLKYCDEVMLRHRVIDQQYKALSTKNTRHNL